MAIYEDVKIINNKMLVPIKSNDKIRVYHGFGNKDIAIKSVLYGLSGQEKIFRTYSYEQVNNPKGLFVSVSFDVVKNNFANSGIIIEFDTLVKNLEAPIWAGAENFFTQGEMTKGFKDGNGFNDELRRKQFSVLNKKYKEKDPEGDYANNRISKSDNAVLANTIFNNSEKQALFIGNLDPNNIKYIWFHHNLYFNRTSNGEWKRYTRKDFINMIKNEINKLRNEKNEKLDDGKAKLFLPNEDFSIEKLKNKFSNSNNFDINRFLKKAYLPRYFYPKQIEQIKYLMQENKSSIIESKQRGDLYHFTRIENCANILSTNNLRAWPNVRKRMMDVFKFGVSTTRDKDFYKTGDRIGNGIEGVSVRITLDGNNLSNKYKITPYNYFVGFTPTKNTISATRNIDNESEEVIVTKSLDGIKNVTNYIKSIHLMPEMQKMYSTDDLIHLVIQAKKLNIPVTFSKEFMNKINMSDDLNLKKLLTEAKQNIPFTLSKKTQELLSDELVNEGVKRNLLEISEKDFEPLNYFNNHKSLNPKVWEGDKMKSDIRKALNEIVDSYLETLTFDVKVEDVFLTGSMANYNYSKYSDFDLHILIDFSKINKDVELVKLFFDADRKNWNNKYEIKIKGYNVELYCQDINEKHTASGLFSIKNNKWVNTPTYEKITVDLSAIRKQANEIMIQVEELEKNATESKINNLLDKIYKIRRTALEKDGEYAVGNLVFKVLRRNNFIKKLNDLKVNLFNNKINKIIN